MRRISFILFLSSFFSYFQVVQADTNYDLHLGASALFGYATESVLHYKTNISTNKRIVYSTAIASLPGLLKEIKDSHDRDNKFDNGDLIADITGALLGSIIANAVNNKLQINLSKDKDFTKVSARYAF